MDIWSVFLSVLKRNHNLNYVTCCECCSVVPSWVLSLYQIICGIGSAWTMQTSCASWPTPVWTNGRSTSISGESAKKKNGNCSVYKICEGNALVRKGEKGYIIYLFEGFLRSNKYPYENDIKWREFWLSWIYPLCKNM